MNTVASPCSTSLLICCLSKVSRSCRSTAVYRGDLRGEGEPYRHGGIRVSYVARSLNLCTAAGYLCDHCDRPAFAARSTAVHGFIRQELKRPLHFSRAGQAHQPVAIDSGSWLVGCST